MEIAEENAVMVVAQLVKDVTVFDLCCLIGEDTAIETFSKPEGQSGSALLWVFGSEGFIANIFVSILDSLSLILLKVNEFSKILACS